MDAIESFLRLAASGDVESVKAACKAVGVDAHDNDGVTGLMTAAAAGKPDVVAWFIQAGADADAQDVHGCTAFHVAAAQGRAKILKLLAPKTSARLQNSPDIDGRLPLHLAVIKNHFRAVRALAANPVVDLNCRDKLSGSPLHVAAALGYARIFRLLFYNPMVNVHATEDDGTNVVHLAAAYGRMATLQFLVESGQFDLDAKSHEGATALHLACIKGDLDIARFLFARTTHSTDSDGDTELHLAVRSLAVTRFLLAAGRHDVGALTNDGSTPLHRAVSVEPSHVGVVKALVKAKAPLHVKDDTGATALQAACHRGNVDVVRFLIDSKSNVNDVDADGFTPLHAAAQNGHLHLVEFLVQSVKVAVDVRSTKGSTPLICALRFAHTKVVKWLVKFGQANVRLHSNFGAPVEVARRFAYLGPHAAALSEWLSRPCARTGCLRRGSKKCGGCFKARYCSTECQRQHWEAHKEHCVLTL